MAVSRRHLIAGAAGAAGVLATAGIARSALAESAPRAQWRNRWSPDPDTDGLDAFEGVEDDHADSHPEGQPHIYVEDGAYRFNMHTQDRDSATDRQRQEVKGMRSPTGGDHLVLDRGQTWRLQHQVFIPESLQATTTFTHIMQLFTPDVGPAMMISLRRVGGKETIEFKDHPQGIVVGRADLVPLKEHWIDLTLELTVNDAPDGAARWVIRDGDTTVLDVRKDGLGVTVGGRCRPKWGIYRSLGDESGSLHDTHLLVRGMRADQRV